MCDSVPVWVVVGVGYVKSWEGSVGGASNGGLCDGNTWMESGRVGCIRSRVYGVSVGAGGEGEGVLGGGLDRCGCLGGEWAR